MSEELENINEDICGTWEATTNIICKNQLKINEGEAFEVAKRLEGNNVKVLKEKYIGFLDEGKLLSSAKKKQ